MGRRSPARRRSARSRTARGSPLALAAALLNAAGGRRAEGVAGEAFAYSDAALVLTSSEPEAAPLVGPALAVAVLSRLEGGRESQAAPLAAALTEAVDRASDAPQRVALRRAQAALAEKLGVATEARATLLALVVDDDPWASAVGVFASAGLTLRLDGPRAARDELERHDSRLRKLLLSTDLVLEGVKRENGAGIGRRVIAFEAALLGRFAGWLPAHTLE